LCVLRLIRCFSGEFLVCPEGVRVLEQGEGPCHIVRHAACESFCLVYLRDGDCRVIVLGEGVLEEACVCHAYDVAVVGIELHMYNLLVV